MKQPLEFAQKLSVAYSEVCKPLCHELNIPQTAFDILMFLANNPEYQTARDIAEIRKIKANLISVNVDRLVKEGYVKRELVDGDRRKTRLLCTEKALLVIEQGRKLQEEFSQMLVIDVPAEQVENFHAVLERMSANLDHLINTK